MNSDKSPPQPSPPPPKAEPIAYADPRLRKRSWRFNVIAIISSLVACISLLVSGVCERTGIQDLSHSMNDIAAAKGLAARYVAAEVIINARPAPRGLTDAEVKAVITYAWNSAQKALSPSNYRGPLQPAQIKTLTSMLSAPGQLIVDPHLPMDFASDRQQLQAAWRGDGDLSIRTDYFDSTLGLPGQGLITEFAMAVSTTGDVSGLRLVTPSKATVTAPNGETIFSPGYLWRNSWGDQVPREVREKFHQRIWALVIFTINVLLAVVLLAAAILLLARKRSGIWLHRIYAWAALPASIAWGVAITWAISDSILGWVYPLLGPLIALAACIYPIVLLAMLRGKRIKNLYL